MFPEADMLWMTLLVFVPSVFAFALIFFPRGSERAMCWWSLVGTAVTLGISIAVFINFKTGVLDVYSAGEPGALTRAKATLERRVQASDERPVGTPAAGNDYVSRYDWIKRFNIEYFLGLDGISLPLV